MNTQFPGTAVIIGGKELIVPALTVGQLRQGLLAKVKEHDKLAEKGEFFEANFIKTEIIFQALKRNYPQMTLLEFEDQVETSMVLRLWWIVLGLSNLGGGPDGSAVDPMTSGPSIASLVEPTAGQ